MMMMIIIPLVVGAAFVVGVLWPTPTYRRSISNDVAKNIDFPKLIDFILKSDLEEY